KCVNCGHKWSTMERTERARALRVVKRSGSREAFDPGKILQGIDIACGKRPVPEVARQELVERVVRAVEEEFQSEVESSEVGRRVAEGLRELDQVVYVRFVSVYEDHATISDLMDAARAEANRSPPAGESDLF
ncbi:MAG: transcriptional repressor NrdR, partial [Phycisphaerae bacterium]|nr:transcriptional repressor NrdR [Phycisphaerae bacterium]